MCVEWLLHGEKQCGVCPSSGGVIFDIHLPVMLLKIQAILAASAR